MPIAAAVAMMVAVVAAIKAMVSEFHAALRNFSDSGPVKISAYQRSEMPSQLVIERLSLKL